MSTSPPGPPRPLVAFVDVDDTLVRSFGSKRIVMSSTVDTVRCLHAEGVALYCWSSGGGEYARESAREAGVEDCFLAFLPKPDVLIDDVKTARWPIAEYHPNEARAFGHQSSACLTVSDRTLKDPSARPIAKLWRPDSRIRAKAIGVAWRGDALLVAAVHHDDGSVSGWRPLGGGIEVGELAVDTVVRELAEEIGARANVVRCLGVLESIFTHHGCVGHEVVFVVEVHLESLGLAELDSFTFREGDSVNFAEWRSLESFRAGNDQLYPAGLIDLLQAPGSIDAPGGGSAA